MHGNAILIGIGARIGFALELEHDLLLGVAGPGPPIRGSGRLASAGANSRSQSAVRALPDCMAFFGR
jgi:hypothetical protein